MKIEVNFGITWKQRFKKRWDRLSDELFEIAWEVGDASWDRLWANLAEHKQNHQTRKTLSVRQAHGAVTPQQTILSPAVNVLTTQSPSYDALILWLSAFLFAVAILALA